MRVLIACEFSGIVRDAFRARGHEAWSIDLLDCEKGEESGLHHTGDVLPHLDNGFGAKWDLIIGHPPCTYLCNSGVRWLAPGGKLDTARHREMMNACDLFAAIYWADCPRVCIENPIMHKYARDYLQSAYKVPAYTQSIQPWQFGHGETKRTCLWLRGLPNLEASNEVEGRKPRVHHASPGPDRWKERSRTLPGIAAAMAEQWSAPTRADAETT